MPEIIHSRVTFYSAYNHEPKWSLRVNLTLLWKEEIKWCFELLFFLKTLFSLVISSRVFHLQDRCHLGERIMQMLHAKRQSVPGEITICLLEMMIAPLGKWQQNIVHLMYTVCC